MKRVLAWVGVALLLTLSAPSAAVAQSRMGGLLDWIHKLSGPQFIGPTLSYAVGGEAARFRLSGSYRWSVWSEDAIDPADGSITMFSVEPAGEFTLYRWLEARAGVALHRYMGDSDGFWHWSLPVYLQGLVPVSDRLDLRLGAGGHYFFEFGPDDFLPLIVEAPRDGGEFTWAFYAGVDWKLF
jgi:hypothetical protein